MSERDSLDILDDIALQRKALTEIQKEGVDLEKVLQALSDERLQTEIANLRERLALAEDGSASFIALNQELNDKLLEQTETRLAKEKAANEKALADLQKTSEVAFKLLGETATKRSEKRVEAINEELAAEQARLQGLQALAAEGNEDAKNNIALTEQRQKQLELAREQQIKRQRQAELALTAVQTYAAKTTAGDPNPLASTIADIEVLRAFIGSLGSFFDGTEDTGTTNRPVDSKGGRLAVIHDNERIIPKKQNKLIGNMSNAELTALAQKEKVRSSRLNDPSTKVVQAIEELKTITKNSPHYLGTDYDSMSGMIIKHVKKGRKLERVHKKKGGIWG